MKCRVKTTFCMGMRRYIAGQEYDFSETDAKRLPMFLEISADTEKAPSPDSSVSEAKSESKGLEAPVKDKMVKKSKTKTKGKGK